MCRVSLCRIDISYFVLFFFHCSSYRIYSVRCFKQIWRVGKVGKVGKVGRVGKVGKEGKEGKEDTVGCESSGRLLSTRFYSSLTKMVKKLMNNFVVAVWKKFDLDTDIACNAKIFLQIYTAIP